MNQIQNLIDTRNEGRKLLDVIKYMCKNIHTNVKKKSGDDISEDKIDDEVTEVPIVDFDMLESFLKAKDSSQFKFHHLSNETNKSYTKESPKMDKDTKNHFSR